MAAQVPRTRRAARQENTTRAEEEVLKVYSTVPGGEETERQEALSVRRFLTEPAYVRVSQGATRNMGNYESLRVDVAITLPCYAEEVDEAVPLLVDKVAQYLEDELKNY